MFTNNKVLEEFIQNITDILLKGIVVIKDSIKVAQHQYERMGLSLPVYLIDLYDLT